MTRRTWACCSTGRRVAASRSPPGSEELVAGAAQEPCLGAQRVRERDLVPLFEVLAPELDEPAAEPEALRAVRVLDDAIERDVLRSADHNLSHFGSPCASVVLPLDETRHAV